MKLYEKIIISIGTLIIFTIIGIFAYAVIDSLIETQATPEGPTMQPRIMAPTPEPTAAPKPAPLTQEAFTNSAYKGNYTNFGFRGSCFRFKAGEICGGESNVLHFKAINGAVWATDWHYSYKGQDYLYAARVKEAKPCGPYLPDFEEIPTKCIAEEIIVPAAQVRTWLKKQFGTKLYEDPEIQEYLEEEYPQK